MRERLPLISGPRRAQLSQPLMGVGRFCIRCLSSDALRSKLQHPIGMLLELVKSSEEDEHSALVETTPELLTVIKKVAIDDGNLLELSMSLLEVLM